MFENIGDKIKIIAKIVFLIGTISSLVLGVRTLIELEAFIGVLYIFFGIFLSWISACLTYAFGELLEKVCSINKKMDSIVSTRGCDNKTLSNSNKINTNMAVNEEKPIENSNKVMVVEHKWRCSNCGEMISEDICPFCGHKY